MTAHFRQFLDDAAQAQNLLEILHGVGVGEYDVAAKHIDEPAHDHVKNVNKYTFRSKCIGVVFQIYNLITKFTALENVMLSMDIARVKGIKKRSRALELLASVGFDEDEANRRVLKLSGGQQQRVAIARALSHNPDIILADEPTGNLDGDTQDEIMQIFRTLADQGKCVILVSHSPQVASMCDETYELKPQTKGKK